MEDLQKIQIELALFRGRVDEALQHVATKTDIAEVKLLIENKLQNKLSAKAVAAIITAVSAALSSVAVAVYSLIA